MYRVAVFVLVAIAGVLASPMVLSVDRMMVQSLDSPTLDIDDVPTFSWVPLSDTRAISPAAFRLVIKSAKGDQGGPNDALYSFLTIQSSIPEKSSAPPSVSATMAPPLNPLLSTHGVFSGGPSLASSPTFPGLHLRLAFKIGETPPGLVRGFSC